MSTSLLQLIALVATFSHLFVSTVNAHGYVTFPASRNYACKEGKADNCGLIIYQPQSLEAVKGFPYTGDANGHLCSAGKSEFSELDRQGASVWPKTKASDVHSFSWQFTAPHATTNFKYFITKPNWDASSSKALTINDFESEPFLTVPMNGKLPPSTMKHDLSSNMPSRSGYHVVYAVWTVDNTEMAFYNCIDLDFGGGNQGGSGGSKPSSSTGVAAGSSSSSSGSSNSSGSSSSSSDSDAGSSGNTSSGNDNTGSSASSGGHKNHSTKQGCRMKQRRRAAPSANVLAARADYHRQKMSLQRKRGY